MGELMTVTSKVLLVTKVVCGTCKREVGETRELHPDSLTTGNTTQRASYHMGELCARAAAIALQRGWHETKEGIRCAHCLALALDPKTDPDPATDHECA